MSATSGGTSAIKSATPGAARDDQAGGVRPASAHAARSSQ
jgi:hypothetical protein